MIRLATCLDIDEIAQVHVKSWIESYQGILRQSVLDAHNLARCQQLWQLVMQDTNHRVWVYALAGRVLGFIDVYKVPNQGMLEIKALYLLQEIQGQGIGRAMMQQAFIWCKSLDYHTVQLDIFDRNSSCGFYDKLGGQRIDLEEASDYADGLKLIYYQWQL